MPVAKLSTFGAPGAMKSDEGNDSLDTFIRQAIGKEPLLSFSRTGDSPVQWIQLLHALDQPDLPGWPLLTPLKVQMHKCEKCSLEFCSPVNYRRHTRLHRRALNFDKESRKYRDLLGAFWDKLLLEEVKEVASLDDVSLKEIPGASLVMSLTSFLHKPGVWALPSVYVKAGSTLSEIIQAKPSRLPISSKELFSILDEASERTFLCAGTAESVQKYIFDGEVAKVGLDLKNLIACTCFLFEQKLVKSWLADKDAEALRCQKLLVEEEEAAQRRQAELLEKKRQKKLRQKEQKARDQTDEGKVDVSITADSLDDPVVVEISSPPAPSDSNSSTLDDISSSVEMICFSNIDIEIEAQEISNEHFGPGTVQSVEPLHVSANNQRQISNGHWWQVQKSQRVGRNGFFSSRDHQALKPEPVHKYATPKDRGPVVNNGKVWTRKVRVENVEGLRPLLQKEAINQTQCDSEVIIGSISVPVKNSIARQLENNLAEAQDHCGNRHYTLSKKHDVAETRIRNDITQCSTLRATNKHWRPVSRHEIGRLDKEEGLSAKVDDCTVPSENGLQSCGVDNAENNHSCQLSDGNAHAEGLLISSNAVKAFLSQRWKEAIAADHVTLVLSPDPEPPGCLNAQSDTPEATPPTSNFQAHTTGSGAISSFYAGNPKGKSTTKPEKSIKKKYIPKQKN
ncbi:PREDICTED: uncharacterized protein LOC109189180 [Ipomoea nil]|uniref:uncharacterized protein LOC109189180 n=1 Tax=Ipomoea nil TaxID=35883 RepID=UPI000900E27D|nr:PREDICTED: uncharacterized protein LOC109189180 [Ipomoea nil]